MAEAPVYRSQQFARRSGVTVRALQHYERLGLLRPCRTAAGFRLYTDADMEVVVQIVALKSLGIPLRRIRALLDADAAQLTAALRGQISALEGRKHAIETALAAARAAEASICRGEPPDLRRIVEVMQMQNNHEWLLKYFAAGVHEQLAERLCWTGEEQATLENEARELGREIEASFGADPASPPVQALIRRWEDFMRSLAGHNQNLVHGLKALYADRANWPEEFRSRIAPFGDEDVWQFVRRGLEARARLSS